MAWGAMSQAILLLTTLFKGKGGRRNRLFNVG
jgi:hypothetical protein